MYRDDDDRRIEIEEDWRILLSPHPLFSRMKVEKESSPSISSASVIFMHGIANFCYFGVQRGEMRWESHSSPLLPCEADSTNCPTVWLTIFLVRLDQIFIGKSGKPSRKGEKER